MGALGFHLYYSNSRLPDGGPEIDALLRQARSNNLRRGLTGYLHYEDGMFFQWIEGDKEMLAPVWDNICADRRHFEICVLDQGPLEERHFSDFSMGYSDKRQNSLFDHLAEGQISRRDGRAYAQIVMRFLKKISQAAA